MRLTIFFDEYKTMAKSRTMKILPMVRWVLEVSKQLSAQRSVSGHKRLL
jgi:hypothetical protein